jgi:hypothetical protein
VRSTATITDGQREDPSSIGAGDHALASSQLLSIATSLVVTQFREQITDPALALIKDPCHEPDLLAIAGVSHACVLLETIDEARLDSNSIVVGILCRTLFEGLITAGWLFLGREDAADKLLAASRGPCEYRTRRWGGVTNKAERSCAQFVRSTRGSRRGTPIGRRQPCKV